MFSDKKYSFPVIECVLAVVLFILHYTSLIDITIYMASPFILLPLCISVAFFRGEVVGLIFSGVCGFACDAVAGQTSVYNTIAFVIIGFFAGVLAKNIFNKNLKGAFILSLCFSAGYFSFKWLIFYLIPDIEGKVYHLFWNIAPSILYTAVFIIPFFYLEKWILKEKKPKNKLYIK